jgi:hypothetical protein
MKRGRNNLGLNDLPTDMLEEIHRRLANRSVANSVRFGATFKRARNATPRNRANKTNTEIPKGSQRVSPLDVRALRERLTLLHTACREFEKISPTRRKQFSRRDFYATFKRILLAESKKMRESLRARKLQPTIRRGDIKILFTPGEGVGIAYTTRVRDTVSSNENNNNDNMMREPRYMVITVKWSDPRGVPFEVYFACGMEKGTEKLLIGTIKIRVGQVEFYTVLDTQEFANMTRAGTRRFSVTRGILVTGQRNTTTQVAIDISRMLELAWGVERKRINVHIHRHQERVSGVINQLRDGHRRFTVVLGGINLEYHQPHWSNSNVSNSNNNNNRRT